MNKLTEPRKVWNGTKGSEPSLYQSFFFFMLLLFFRRYGSLSSSFFMLGCMVNKVKPSPVNSLRSLFFFYSYRNIRYMGFRANGSLVSTCASNFVKFSARNLTDPYFFNQPFSISYPWYLSGCYSFFLLSANNLTNRTVDREFFHLHR